MSRKTERKPNDPERSKRFIETAKEVGADDPKALDNAIKKMAAKPTSQPKKPT